MKKYSTLLLLSIIFLFSCNDVLFEEEPANDPVGNFESLWNTFNERYAVFEQREINWQNLYNQYRTQITSTTTDDELFEIITSMLAHLDDGHVSLAADGRQRWNSNQEFRERNKFSLFSFELIRNNYMDTPVTIIDNQYAYGTINGELGYLYINLLSGSKPIFIDDFINEMKDMKGIIIDIRHNDGGDFTNGEIIASRFAGQKILAFSGTPKNGPGPNDYAETTDYYIEAGGPAQYTKPIVVLTNDYTLSAAENLALYFRALPNVTMIGENTAGAMGEYIEKEMPNGWIYSISGQIITAADGNSYEGPGIPPDIYEENTLEEIEMGMDRILELAIEAFP